MLTPTLLALQISKHRLCSPVVPTPLSLLFCLPFCCLCFYFFHVCRALGYVHVFLSVPVFCVLLLVAFCCHRCHFTCVVACVRVRVRVCVCCGYRCTQRLVSVGTHMCACTCAACFLLLLMYVCLFYFGQEQSDLARWSGLWWWSPLTSPDCVHIGCFSGLLCRFCVCLFLFWDCPPSQWQPHLPW